MPHKFGIEVSSHGASSTPPREDLQATCTKSPVPYWKQIAITTIWFWWKHKVRPAGLPKQPPYLPQCRRCVRVGQTCVGDRAADHWRLLAALRNFITVRCGKRPSTLQSCHPLAPACTANVCLRNFSAIVYTHTTQTRCS